MGDWLDSIRMGRYWDHFAAGGYSLGMVLRMKRLSECGGPKGSGSERGRGQGAGSRAGGGAEGRAPRAEAGAAEPMQPGWVPASQVSTALLSRDACPGHHLMGHQKKILGSIQTMRAQHPGALPPLT